MCCCCVCVFLLPCFRLLFLHFKWSFPSLLCVQMAQIYSIMFYPLFSKPSSFSPRTIFHSKETFSRHKNPTTKSCVIPVTKFWFIQYAVKTGYCYPYAWNWDISTGVSRIATWSTQFYFLGILGLVSSISYLQDFTVFRCSHLLSTFFKLSLFLCYVCLIFKELSVLFSQRSPISGFSPSTFRVRQPKYKEVKYKVKKERKENTLFAEGRKKRSCSGKKGKNVL